MSSPQPHRDLDLPLLNMGSHLGEMSVGLASAMFPQEAWPGSGSPCAPVPQQVLKPAIAKGPIKFCLEAGGFVRQQDSCYIAQPSVKLPIESSGMSPMASHSLGTLALRGF